MSTLFQLAPKQDAKPERMTPAEIVEACFEATAEALGATESASTEDIHKALARARESMDRNRPLDLLEALARVQGHDEERMGGAILTLSDAVASTLSPAPASIPFASKLIAPSAFYEVFDSMHSLAKLLLSPVIYAEDTDAIGTASINPIAARMLGEEIHHTVGKRSGIRPFITNARMEYESWAFLCRKHFEL